MKRLYWQDTYLFETTAIITQVGSDEIGRFLRLDQTIFHPQGGGQPSDDGTINGIKVTKLKDCRDLGEINHYVEDASGFCVGDKVHLRIDANWRLECAALHTAGHVTGGVLRFDFGYKQVLGANHFPKQAKVEYALDGRDIAQSELCGRVQKVLAECRSVTEAYDAEKVRIIRIEGLGEERCSGTHVSSSGEIDAKGFVIRKIERKGGRLKIGYDARYRGGETT